MVAIGNVVGYTAATANLVSVTSYNHICEMTIILLISIIVAYIKISRHSHALWDGPF